MIVNITLIIVVLAGARLMLGGQPTNDVPATVAPLGHHEFEAAGDTLTSLLTQQGAGEAFAYARQRLPADASFARDCHPLMHGLGHAAFAHYGSYAAASAIQDEMCNSGYVHGLIEAFFSQSDNLERTVVETCPVSGVQDLRQWQCYHGIGHGLMLVQNRQVASSIGQCERLPSEFAVKACVNGVYMERFIAVDHTGQVRPGATASIEDCRQAKSAYKSACYYYAPTAYLALHDDGYLAAYEWCHEAEAKYISSCAGGVGGQAMKDNVSRPSVAAAICRSFATVHQAQCVDGAMGTYLHTFGSSSAAAPLCSREFSDFEAACRRAVAIRQQRFGV